MVKLIILMGIPGAGKDYVAKIRYSDFVEISSDKIREEIFDDINDQEHNSQVFNLMFQRTVDTLEKGLNCIYNATNLNEKKRINLIKKIKSKIKDIAIECVLVAPPIETCLKRNKIRERIVPEKVIWRMTKNFQPPSLSEGFDKITILGTEKTNILKTIMEQCEIIPHDNPHHTLTIGQHMEAAAKYYMGNACEYLSYLSTAVRLHDIGKFYTKEVDENGFAHYYNHEKIGAYLYLSNSCGTERDLYITNLIFHHMDFFKGEEYIEKIRKRMGEKFYIDLNILHKCDLAAY